MARDKIKGSKTLTDDDKTVAKGKIEKRHKKHYQNNNSKEVKKKLENKQPQASLKRGKLPTNWKTFTSASNSNSSDKVPGTIIPKNLTAQIARKDLENTNKEQHKKNKPSKYSLPCVAIDCEMVGVGYKGSENMLARVSLIDENGKVAYDTFVKPMEPVTDYRTFVSGVRPHDLENGLSFQQVQEDVHNIVKDKLLIGHALKHDLKALLIKHPQKLIRDTSKFKKFKEYCNGRTPGLKKLAEKLLGREIQKGEHSSVEDAKATMDLYLKFRKQIEYEFKHYKFNKSELTPTSE